LLVCALTATGAGVAQAASGGGCGGKTTTRWGSFAACIGAPFFGIGRPDGYVTLAANHPPCNIVIDAYDSGGSVVSTKTFSCPKTANNVRYIGNDFPGYGTYFTVVYVANVSSGASPNLNLP
jgi:hypothetical protein